jgi:hypothetical protein
MINRKIIYGSILAFVLLSGCGSDIESGSFNLSSNGDGNLTGIFIDSKVEGVKYITSSGVEGYTNKKGEYKYNDGDEVTFYLGEMNLGSTEASNLTTVFELPDSTKVATLLQLLDKDGNPNNGISISDEDYRIFKNANFELKEVDAQNINFRKKFKDTMGYDIQTDSESINNHALESLKDELVHKYDSDLFRYLNTELKFSGIIGNTIYEKNPNDYLNTYNARLRIYFYAKYVREAIDEEIALYDNAIRRTEITKEAVDKTAKRLTDNIVKFYSLVGLVKGKYDDLIELKRLKDNIPYSAIDPTNYNNRVRDFAIKKFAHSEGKEALIEFTHKLTGKDTLLGKVISDCVVTSKPSALDLLQCEARLAGTAGEQLNGALGEIYKLGYLRTQNAGRLAQDYLDLYYAFNRRTDLVYSIIESMAKEMARELTFTLDELNKMNISDMTDDDEDILEEILDVLSQKRFKNTTRISDEWVAGWQYTFDYSKKMIVEYIKTVDSLQNYFTDTFDKETIRELDSDYIDFDVQLFPADGDDLYKIAFQLTNKTPFDLKATRGYVIVELDGKQIDKVVFFKEQVDGKNLNENQLYSEGSRFYKSKVFPLPTDKKILTNGVLKVSYKVDYIPSRHNVGEKVQEGVKYYELSKTTLIDNLSKPLIDLEIPKFIKVNEEVKLDASNTTSIMVDDTFTYNWEYLTTENENDIGLTDSTSDIASIKASKIPDNLAFQKHDFKLTVISNINKRESIKEFSIFVKNDTPIIIKLDAPKLESSVTITNGEATLKWNKVENATSYKIYVSEKQEVSSTNNIASYPSIKTIITIPNIKKGKKYYVAVEAKNIPKKLLSSLSNEVEVYEKEDVVTPPNSTTPIDTTTLTLQDCKDKTLNQTFITNTWTTSNDEWNRVHIACLKIFSDNELDNSNIPNTDTGNDTPSTDTPSNSSRTSIDYMKNHKTEKLVSTDCSTYKFGETVSLVYIGGALQTPVSDLKGWGDISKVVHLAPSDNMMQSINGCNDVVKLIEYGGLSFSKAVESVVRSRTKETSPFSDIWDTSASATPTNTTNTDDIAQHQNDFEAYSAEIKLNTVATCKTKYGNYTFMELSTFANIPTNKDKAVGQTMNGDASYCLTVLLQSGDIKIGY